MGIIINAQYTEDIIVGGEGRGRRVRGFRGRRRHRPNYDGLNFWMPWDSDRTGYFQEINSIILVDAVYHSPSGEVIHLYRIHKFWINIVENTLDLVPPDHLRWFNRHKNQGIIFADSAGRGGSASYTGGLNPGYDDRSTTFFDERNGILITHGAVWRHFHKGISPTILHEIGHVMTRNGRINYNHFTPSNRQRLSSQNVSRSGGINEGLCNAYMFFLCYGSNNPIVRSFGNRPANIQKSASTRAALRRCPAFSTMLTGSWSQRFNERP